MARDHFYLVEGTYFHLSSASVTCLSLQTQCNGGDVSAYQTLGFRSVSAHQSIENIIKYLLMLP